MLAFGDVLRLVVAFVFVTGCGRAHFDDIGDARTTSDDVRIDGITSTCVPASAQGSCSTTLTRVSSVTVGIDHACAIRDSGLACWGRNDEGQLGLCETQPMLVPHDSFGFAVAELAVGERHTCARLTNAEVWCWGSRYEGETGDGVGTASAMPHRVAGAWLQISAQRFHTCGIATDHTLWCWGHNDEGQLGLGDTIDRGTPTQVGTATSWASVDTGGSQTCALDTAGVAYCWGLNGNGELGDNSKVQRSSPVAVQTSASFTALALGKNHSCALDSGGNVWCWGMNDFGQLGNGASGPNMDALTPTMVALGPWQTLAAGGFATCALDATGALYCWGDNSAQTILPDMTMSRYGTPQRVDAGPFVEVSAGGYNTCVRDAAGVVQCYGENLIGQVGVGDTQLHTTLQPLCFPD